MHATSSTRQLLAVERGSPVRQAMLPYGRQAIDEEDIQAVVDVLRSEWLTTGPKVEEFEEAFAARVRAKYAVAFSSGTAALHGAAFSAGLKAGDEAITTPMTFAVTANCLNNREFPYRLFAGVLHEIRDAIENVAAVNLM